MSGVDVHPGEIELQDPKAKLGRKEGSEADVSIGRASIIIEPRNLKAWLTAQLLTINWTNVALIVTVIAISANINGQLNEQRVQYANAQDAIVELKAQLMSAGQVAQQLAGMQQQVVDFNRTLSYAVSLGFVNITGQLSDQSARLDMIATSFAAPTFDDFHFVGNATNGLGTTFMNGWATDPLHPVRFWIDRNMVHLQGRATGQYGVGLFYLPLGYRPREPLIYVTVPSPSSQPSQRALILITPSSGQVGIVGENGVTADCNLDGFSFSLL